MNFRSLRQGLAPLVLSLAAACSSPTTPGTDTTPPDVVVTATGGMNHGSISASASDAQSSIRSGTLYLNGTQVRSGTGPLSVDSTLTPGNYTARADFTSDGGTGSSTKTFTVTAPAAPSINAIAPVTFEEDGLATSVLSATNCTSPTYSLGTPSVNYTPSIVGNILTRRFAANANGTGTVPVMVQCAEGNATTNAQATATPMSDFAFELREARSDSLIKTPSWFYYVVGAKLDSVQSVNGVFRGQVTPGAVTWHTVKNADTFRSDRLQNADGTLIGVNWPDNDGVTQTLNSDMTSPGKIIRLATQGSPYGSLAEMMRIYAAVWTPDGKHTVPVFPVARISIYTGPANANWGCIRAPTPAELATITQGATDTQGQFQTADYQIRIDTITVVPTEFIGDVPQGQQVVCIGNTSGNVTIRNADGSVRGSRAQLLPGFNRLTVRDELYEEHSGQKLEDNANGNTFFAANRPNGISDLVPGDVDIVKYVNNLFARDAEKKRLGNAGTPYILKQ